MFSKAPKTANIFLKASTGYNIVRNFFFFFCFAFTKFSEIFSTRATKQKTLDKRNFSYLAFAMCVRLLRSVVFVCHFFCSFPTLCHCQHSLLLVCGCFGCKLHFCWNKCDGNNAASSNTVAGLKDRHWQWLWGKPSFSFRLTFHFFNSFQAMELLQFRSWCGCCLIVCLPLTV